MTPCRWCGCGRGRPRPVGSLIGRRAWNSRRSAPGSRIRPVTSAGRGRRSAAKSRTTAAARAPESSQLDGYCEPEIGCESVWPSTTTGCVRSSRTTPAILSTRWLAAGLSVASPEAKKTLSVSSWMTRPRRRTVTCTLPLSPAPLERLSIRRLSALKSSSSCLAFLASSAAVLRARVVERGQRAHRRQRRLDRRLLGRLCRGARVDHRLAAAEHGARERVLQRPLQRLELGRVHRGDREEHHEEAEQERHHVREGHEPALLVLMLFLVVASPTLVARDADMTDYAAAFAAGAPLAWSPSEGRSPGGTKVISFSWTTRGLSPAWIERMPSTISARE